MATKTRKKGLGRSNDAIPEDEMMLAELIQNAQRFGLNSTKVRRFEPKAGEECDDPWADPGTLATPPAGAVRCCTLGAQSLQPLVSGVPVMEWAGNDADDGTTLRYYTPGTPEGQRFIRDWNIGAAFEQALRP